MKKRLYNIFWTTNPVDFMDLILEWGFTIGSTKEATITIIKRPV